MSQHDLHIIGGGLAGCEAAWFAARKGINVGLYEMRPQRMTAAHQTNSLAELVCSNSLRSDDSEYNAVGLLHDEMRRMGSLVLQMADRHKLPAGSALAVDREAFAADITAAIESQDNITLHRRHVASPDEFGEAPVIIAAGPLASGELSQWIGEVSGGEPPAFFDAIAPIVYYDSIDFSKVWKQSRYDKSGADYINCPLNRAEYEAFVQALCEAEKTEFKEWERNTPYFEACLPIEVMAERGVETLRFGAMKPVGLTNPHAKNGEKPYAVVQLRQDNKLGSLWNIVGFQTKLKHHEQLRIFRTLPGLEQAEFARLGGIHRNSYIRSPQLLAHDLSLRNKGRDKGRDKGRNKGRDKGQVFFAGQITGVEGYVESSACGILAGCFATARCKGESWTSPPLTSALGALLNHITVGANVESFQPMNINFGLFPPIENDQEEFAESGRRIKRRLKGRDRKLALTERAKSDFGDWLGE